VKVGHRIGILGGGQLARMLVLEGIRMGFEMHVLCPDSKEPAAQATSHHMKGNPNSLDDLKSFFQRVDLVTLESEFYSGNLLDTAAKAVSIPMFPNPACIRLLQDRLPQKELLKKFKIPTAPFVAVQSLKDLEIAKNQFQKFVLKKRCGGYDGNGTFIIDSFNKKSWTMAVDKISKGPSDYIAEQFISFRKEMAIILSRSRNGTSIHFPLVETKQTENRCDWVYGPTDHPGGSSVIKKLMNLLESIDYVGSIGFELFDTGEGLLVNEVAPRVHNSGHYSMNAMSECQFTTHLKSILGLPLIQPKSLSENFVMVNLIGARKTLPDLPEKLTGFFHWYGKTENRNGRKMGHINYIGKGKGLLRRAIQERNLIKGL